MIRLQRCYDVYGFIKHWNDDFYLLLAAVVRNWNSLFYRLSQQHSSVYTARMCSSFVPYICTYIMKSTSWNCTVSHGVVKAFCKESTER